MLWSAVYSSFGEATINVAVVENSLRFPDQYYDSETGLHYNYQRYYDPETGRYITPDPIGLAGGINLFAYIQNDPVNWVDPWGLYRSHWLLRSFVPCQVFYNEGRTALENGNYGLAIADFVGMFVEQVIFVTSLGTEGTCSIATKKGLTTPKKYFGNKTKAEVKSALKKNLGLQRAKVLTIIPIMMQKIEKNV